MEKYGTAREGTGGNIIRRIKEVICKRDN